MTTTINTDHTQRKHPPATPGMDLALVIDGTQGQGPRSEELRSYYGGKQFEYGWASLCKMTVPEGLVGKTTLDVGCRRGRGVYKLSERVGDLGRAIGLDWGRDYIEEAAEWSAHAAVKSGLTHNNMVFVVGFPEDLRSAGIEDNSVDMVWVNSVINLAFDRQAALREFARVLKPGGVLVCETVIADKPRDRDVVERAKAIGNSVQAAPFQDELATELFEAGLEVVEALDAHAVSAETGFVQEYTVDVIPSEEDCAFTAEVIHARKLIFTRRRNRNGRILAEGAKKRQ